jgi:hypothetical protein
MTTAVANGYSIARSAKAREAWERRHAQRSGTGSQTPAQFTATLGRIGAMLPGVVRVH